MFLYTDLFKKTTTGISLLSENKGKTTLSKIKQH